MTDYGHELLFGSFLTPSARSPERVVELAQLSERAGLDLVTFQDHPYLPEFLDAWTLLTCSAADGSNSAWGPARSGTRSRPTAAGG